MILGNKHKLKLLERYVLPEITIDGSVIPYVNFTKYLGVHLSRSLTWDVHISQLSRLVYGALNSLKHRKYILSIRSRKLLVSAIIFSHHWLLLGGVSKLIE